MLCCFFCQNVLHTFHQGMAFTQYQNFFYTPFAYLAVLNFTFFFQDVIDSLRQFNSLCNQTFCSSQLILFSILKRKHNLLLRELLLWCIKSVPIGFHHGIVNIQLPHIGFVGKILLHFKNDFVREVGVLSLIVKNQENIYKIIFIPCCA